MKQIFEFHISIYRKLNILKFIEYSIIIFNFFKVLIFIIWIKTQSPFSILFYKKFYEKLKNLN